MISIDIEELTRHYLFASSAGHVYQRFIENDSLKNLAKTTAPDILVKEYRKRTEKRKKKIEDVVVAYAILVSITFLDYSKALSVFDRIDLSKLEWGQDVKDRYVRNVIPTVFATGCGKGTKINVEETKAQDSGIIIQRY